MLKLHSCPRCDGAILEYQPPDSDGGLCVNCGWRRKSISSDVLVEVRAHLGQPYVDDHYARKQIARGKPQPSGWERAKRRRERELVRQAGQ